MTKRIKNLENLYETLEKEEPTKVLYDLSKGENRSELLITYSDRKGSKLTNRIESSPLVKLCRDGEGISIDIMDSDKNADKFSYRNLTPQGATYNPSTYGHDDLGDLAIDLGGGAQLGISHYARAA